MKLEFLTAFSGADGYLRSVVTDEGETLPVVEDKTKTNIEANALVRVISNYASEAVSYTHLIDYDNKRFFLFPAEPVLLGEHPCDGRCGSGIAVRSAERTGYIYPPRRGCDSARCEGLSLIHISSTKWWIKWLRH